MPIVSSMGPRVPLLAGVRALLAGAVVLALALGPGEVAPRAAAADLEPPALPEFSSTFGGLTSGAPETKVTKEYHAPCPRKK